MRPLLESLEDRNMTFTINMMINNTGSAVHEGISRGIMIILIDIVGSNRKLLRFAQMVSERDVLCIELAYSRSQCTIAHKS